MYPCLTTGPPGTSPQFIYLFFKILNFCKNLLHTGLLKMRYPVTKPRVRFHLKQSDNGSKLGVLKPQASPWVYDNKPVSMRDLQRHGTNRIYLNRHSVVV